VLGTELETTQLYVFCVLCGLLVIHVLSDPVFFGCVCGKDGLHLPSPTAWGSGSNSRRISSVGAAIEFAKANNLLGIFIDADLLVRSHWRLCNESTSELTVWFRFKYHH
jgi:hypothetical protein